MRGHGMIDATIYQALNGGHPMELGTLGAITLFVRDRQRARDFYARMLAAEPIFEDDTSAAFRLDNVIVNLLVSESADELITPAPVADANSGAAFQLTLEVTDVDATCRELAQRGIALLNGPMDRRWGVRTAAFEDPDGHVWEVAAPVVAEQAS
jgi:lactoylglutathione lyase